MDAAFHTLWKSYFAFLKAYDLIPPEKRNETYTETILTTLATLDIMHSSENLVDYSTFCKKLKPMADDSQYLHRFDIGARDRKPKIVTPPSKQQEDVILGPGSEADFIKVLPFMR
jgi:hypothetical protein